MNLLCGVFFPVEQLPAAFQAIAAFSSAHAPRWRSRGRCCSAKFVGPVLHVLVLLAYAATGFYAATILSRRRLLK